MIVAKLLGPEDTIAFKFFRSLVRARLFVKEHRASINRIELYLTDALSSRSAREAVVAGLARLVEVAQPSADTIVRRKVARRRHFPHAGT